MSKSRIWCVAGAICCVVAVCFVTAVNKQEPRKEIAEVGRQPVKLHQRRSYPYSVISGGVESGAELRTALLTDSVAAAHYARFHVERTEVSSLNQPRRVFVSYRKGDRIYWTRNRLTIPKGETVLTDGNLSARTRCGNRLSDTPQTPVLTKDEPSAKEFEAALDADSSPARWNAESWRDNEATSKEPKDYQSSFGPDLGVVARKGSGTGGSGGFPSGGASPLQSSPTASSVPRGSTTGGVNMGNSAPIFSNPSAPPILSVAPILFQPVTNQPFNGFPTGGTTTTLNPAAPYWAPVSYSFLYLPQTFGTTFSNSTALVAASYSSANAAQTATPYGWGNTTSKPGSSAILLQDSAPTLSLVHDNVPISESPEPHPLALVLAAGILACAFGGVRQRLRNRPTEM